jgi:hypothetical protein
MAYRSSCRTSSADTKEKQEQDLFQNPRVFQKRRGFCFIVRQKPVSKFLWLWYYLNCKMRKLISGTIGIGLFLNFAVVIAAAGSGFASIPQPTGPIRTVQNVLDLIQKILLWVSTAFWLAAGAATLYAAYLYLTAAGNDERVKKAKQQLLYAVIAIIIAIMAAGLPALINSFLNKT